MVLNPYALSFINLLLAVSLLIATLFYTLFLKKKINFLILLVLLSILASWSIFRLGVYESGDFQIHVFDSISFYSSLSQGILFPKWAGGLNATFGYPLFIFTFPLPYYIISFFHFLGFGFISSFKLFLFSTFLLSGIFMYLWIKDIFGKFPAFVASIFYLFAPYHLIDLHFRSSAGELLSFVFMPLTLFSFRKLVFKNNFIWVIISSITVCCLVLSHQAISIGFLPFAFFYSIAELKHKKVRFSNYISVFFSFGLGLVLSAYYWLPAVYEGIYTKRDEVAAIVFPNITQLLYSTYRFGLLFQGPKGELSFLLGYAQVAVLLLLIFLFFKNRIDIKFKYLFYFFLIAFCVYLFMILSVSKPIWESIPLIKNFQFTYRLLAIMSLITAVFPAILVSSIKNRKIIYILLIIAIGLTILNWGNRKTLPLITDSTLERELPMSTSKIEALVPAFPKWVDSLDITEKKVPSKHIQSTGNCSIKELPRSDIEHKYMVYAQQKCSYKEFTLYFPGWYLYINKVNYPITISQDKPMGIISFKLNKGIYVVNLKFEDTEIVKISKSISGLGVLSVFLLVLISLPKRKISIG